MKAKITFLSTLITASMVLFLFVLTTGNLRAQEQCLKDAWKTFNENKYEDAIKYSDKCIDDFGKLALKQQAKLEADGIQPPPTGSVTNDAEKHNIFQRGFLNDVATAYYIKGRSAEYLYKAGGAKSAEYKDKAERAYKKTCEYKYGRTWDPKGWFWSPCEAANERLPLD